MASTTPGKPAHVFYAMKANSNLGVLKTLAALGAGADTVSEGEIRRALAAGVPSDRIIFSGAFRRLGRKTQVHPVSSNDHIHTRLTHSLEVAQIGREFGAALGFEHRRAPTRRVGGFAGALSLPTFLCAQESRSPAGANSRHGTRQ